MPAALASRPVLLPGADDFYYAYLRLTGSRTANGSIPLSEVYFYSLMFKQGSPAQQQDLLRFVSACDAAYHRTKERLKSVSGERS